MQLSTQDQHAHRRFRNNLIASRIFTLFGCLVLVTFLLLIFHIAYNAMPLLQTPKISFKEDFDTLDFDVHLGLSSSPNGVSQLGIKDCHLIKLNYRSDAPKAQQIIQTRTRMSCYDKVVPMTGKNDAMTYFAAFNDNEVVEIHRLLEEGSRLQSQIIASFIIDKQVGERMLSHSVTALFEKQLVYLWSQSDATDDIVVIKHDISASDLPTIFTIENSQVYFPMTLSDAHVTLNEQQIKVIDLTGNTEIANFQEQDIRALLRLPNGRGFVVQNGNGYVVYGLTNQEGILSYLPIARYSHAFEGALLSLQYEAQSGALFMLSDQGQVYILNPSTFEIVNTVQSAHSLEKIVFASPYLFGLQGNKVNIYETHNMAGITTWNALFEPVHYIGYDDQAYIWQSSQVVISDQAKFSLIPLIIGSLKASVLALFVAIPLSLGAAIFTAYLAPEKTRSWLKPSLEMLEAVPAVVIGFIAAVWLAPLAEKYLIAMLIVILFLPLFIGLCVAIHSLLSARLLKIYAHKSFIFGAIVALMAFILLVSVLGIEIQTLLAEKNIHWANDLMASITLSKSSIIVALALGIAITPSIYTLIDDAINEVPRGAVLAAFALGATQTQTLLRVVLVVAFPSIISACMLGFGRAFGETMIVLMVTGNTPLPDWELLHGLRSLTSNLAIELQESSKGSTHFHIMFLTAAILFIFTFSVNTLASVIKSNMLRRASDA